MAWETSGWQSASASSEVNAALVQESRRAFMSRVYGWMFAGLMVTGLVALFTVSNQQLLNVAVAWRIPLLLAELGLVFLLSLMAPRLSGPVAGLMFLAYSALTGMTLSIYFLIYTAGSIGQAFLLTAGVFGALSLYGTLTKKDLSAWGSFLFMGLVGVVLAGLVNLFLRSDAMSFVVACASVVVFAGLTAYDTQKLREMHATTGYSSAASVSIVGALTLYLDFINLFLALLRLLGRRR
ncbi:Bax inhibitor-1/YccA family protein [Hyalangium rubrum]|uniref:Bax inhibitor-1/YccA family protein n=1 Tax=Hyalangium rubrum TaxID=3103134 RepID=A0ABU5GUJ3_9BACT|nr:Bax inhibitor-1/YccA family protein [Hyalangium sp. s54d21]MDY7224853.1 Bax inhibitor-1/YccA family protein [Hyalangium sp. s54d21]